MTDVAGGRLRDGVVHVKPAQQAGRGQQPEHGALRSGQGKAAAPAADSLAVPDQHAEAGAVEEGQPRQISDAKRRFLPADVGEAGVQGRHVGAVQFTAQTHHGDAVAIMDGQAGS